MSHVTGKCIIYSSLSLFLKCDAFHNCACYISVQKHVEQQAPPSESDTQLKDVLASPQEPQAQVQ